MKYELLKDMPGVKAGTPFRQFNNGWAPEGLAFPLLEEGNILDTNWFKEVNSWPVKWEDIPRKSFENVYWCTSLGVRHRTEIDFLTTITREEVPTEAHTKSILAFAQLSMLAKEMNGDWVPDWLDKTLKFVVKLSEYNNEKLGLGVSNYYHVHQLLAFRTKEMAEFSLLHHEQLWRDYWMID